MSLTVRPLVDSDIEASLQLSRLAFGGPPIPTDPAERPTLDDRAARWGAFDEGGRLVARTTDLFHEQWWGGRVLPASGIASVAVVPEERGRGAGREVLAAALRGARDRGAAVAALFCTSTAVYRSMGFEACGVLRWVDLPTAHLDRRLGRDIGVRLRAGDGRDWPAVRAVYDAVAAGGNGLLTRRGPLFPDPDGEELPSGLDGVTLAIDDAGDVVGYLSWERGRGYHDTAVITVPDCIALTADAAAALIGSLAGWVTVAPTVRLRLPTWADAIATALPLERLREHHVDVWMHRPLDVVAAVAARGWPPVVEGTVSVRIADPLLAENDACWRLSVRHGRGTLEPTADGEGPTLHVRGWSLLWSGAATTAQVRQAGLLTGPTDSDPWLDQLLTSRPAASLLDYF